MQSQSFNGEQPVNVTVSRPNGTVLYSNTKESSGDMVFSAGDTGSYKFCFHGQKFRNSGDNFVSIEIITENDTRLPVSSVMHSETVEGRSIRKIMSELTKIGHTMVNTEHLQRYMRSIEHRDEYLIMKASKTITILSALQTAILCLLSIFQIACVHVMFSRNRRQALV